MSGSQNKRVLLVDDDRVILHVLSSVLGREYIVHVCENGLDAVQLVHRWRPDVIVCDERMPTHDGFWLTAQVRAIDPTLPVILHSAYARSACDVPADPACRPFAFVIKGASLTALRQAIRDAMISLC